MEANRPYRVYINGVEHAGVYAPSYSVARKLARSLYRVSCDVIG